MPKKDNLLFFDAVVFDLDGVITKTAAVHGHAWKQTFDEYLRLREKRDKEPFREFTHEGDYLPYVDGKPRYEGVKSFLESRDISLSWGDPSDPPDRETVCGLGNRKNFLVLSLLHEDGVEVYPLIIEFIKQLKSREIAVGVASSSKNCREVLQEAGIEDLFATRVDGLVSAELGLKGKPEPDIFERAASDLGASVPRSVVVEDAISGVQAGRNGAFGLVIGIARRDNINELIANGADVAVSSFEPITLEWCNRWFQREPADLFPLWNKAVALDPDLEKEGIEINPCFRRSGRGALLDKKKRVFFLDYDGTLTPIVSRPELAVISAEMREAVRSLAKKHTVAVVSGRMREDVEKLMGLKDFIYAGSHGFDIAGPGLSMVHPGAREAVPAVDQAISEFKSKLGSIEGVLIEEKKFSVAVHYRMLKKQEMLTGIETIVKDFVAGHPVLRLMHGKKVFEVLPSFDWNKGKAVRWLMEALGFSWDEHEVVYIGDDTTDEDAFRIVRTRGTGILVSGKTRISAADFRVSSPDEVKRLLSEVIAAD